MTTTKRVIVRGDEVRLAINANETTIATCKHAVWARIIANLLRDKIETDKLQPMLMRTADEAQRAHDVLGALLMDRIPLVTVLNMNAAALDAACDVLCWLLGHDNNPTFALKLEALEAQITKLGYAIDDDTGEARLTFKRHNK